MRKWVVCLLVGIAAATAGAEEARPWEAWQPPVVALPQPNGFDTFLKAFELKTQVDEQFPSAQPPVEGQPPDRWGEGPANLPLPDRVALYAEVLKLVRGALAQECLVPPPTNYAEVMPHLASFRSVARLLAMEAEVHRLEGDYLAAANSALDGFMVGRAVSSQRTLISYLVGIACEAIATKSLDETVPDLKAEECRTVLARLLQIESKRLPIAGTFTGEETFARRGFKELIAEQAKPQEVPADLTPEDKAEGEKLLASLNAKGWEAIAQVYDGFRAAAALPYPHRAPAMPQTDDPLMAIMVPVVDKVLFKDAQALTALHLREAELAARAYRLEKKQLPASLTALVPEYLQRASDDPFGEGALHSVVTGGKLTLYSVGPDGVDDGGKSIDGKFPQADAKGDIVVLVEGR